MAEATTPEITTYKDENGQFSVRAITDDTGTWYIAQDIAKSAGWEGHVGKPSPTREIPGRYKKAVRITDTSSQQGRPLAYEVLCLNGKGVWLFVDAIKKTVYRPVTSKFMSWFEQNVLVKTQKTIEHT